MKDRLYYIILQRVRRKYQLLLPKQEYAIAGAIYRKQTKGNPSAREYTLQLESIKLYYSPEEHMREGHTRPYGGRSK